MRSWGSWVCAFCLSVLYAIPCSAQVDQAALSDLVDEARRTRSDALIVIVDNKVLVEEYFGGHESQIEAMSVTKSVVAVIIGHLVSVGSIPSVDEPMHTYFPEWKQGRKESITLRHVLSHHTGLQANQDTKEIYASPDFVQLALCAELVSDPGTLFFYNNKAVNLLAGVVEAASGQRLDHYAGKNVFEPLGISEFGWTLDKAGQPHVMAGLQLGPMDLARIGQLILNKGIWDGRQLVSPEWIDEMLRPQDLFARCGLLWWITPASKQYVVDDTILDAWRAGGASETFIEKASAMKDVPMSGEQLEKAIVEHVGNREEWDRNTWQSGNPDVRVLPGPVLVAKAEGYLGQYLIIRPRENAVAVRMIRSSSWVEDSDSFKDFSTRFAQLFAE